MASVTRLRHQFSAISSTFDRAIGDAAPLSVVTVESNSGIAAPGGLQIELSGVKALDVIVSDVTGGDALPNRQTLQDQAALQEPFNDTTASPASQQGPAFLALEQGVSATVPGASQPERIAAMGVATPSDCRTAVRLPAHGRSSF